MSTRRTSITSLSLAAVIWLANVINAITASPWFSLPPELGIARVSNAVAVAWPTWAFTYRLEGSDTMSDSNTWRIVPDDLRVVGDKLVKTIDSPNGRQFFRLSGTTQIPLFQFAIFYNGDMELNGAATLHVRGRVHGNANLYTGSSSSQYFYDDVTVSGVISNGMRYGWPTNGAVYYYAAQIPGTPLLTLTMNTNIASEVVREILHPPPPDEPINSPMGHSRYYNKAELVILVTDTNVSIGVKQPYAASLATIDWLAATNFVSTNKTFTDQREFKTVRTTEIDVGKFIAWASTNSTVIAILGASTPPNLIYARDVRITNSARLTAVRLVNGQTLPSRGLTVATPNPLYTKGHYNQPTSSHLGTTNTSNTKPASLICDAYTLLSGAFRDEYSSGSYTTRVTENTTVVAAVATGNSPSSPIYSGGVNNLPRVIEAWSGKTYTLNGSLVCLFPSAMATAPWLNPGIYYSAPTRNINFDSNFLDPTRLPPGTPFLRIVAPAE